MDRDALQQRSFPGSIGVMGSGAERCVTTSPWNGTMMLLPRLLSAYRRYHLFAKHWPGHDATYFALGWNCMMLLLR